MYDIGEVKPFKTTGYHSLQAGGTGHNTDNAVDAGPATGVVCATFDVAPPPTDPPSATPTPVQSVEGATATPTMAPTATPTPFQSVQGVTAVPVSTVPPTATDSGSLPPANGGPAVPLLLLALSCLFGAIALKPVIQSRR
jgi:hypothetical protein